MYMNKMSNNVLKSTILTYISLVRREYTVLHSDKHRWKHIDHIYRLEIQDNNDKMLDHRSCYTWNDQNIWKNNLNSGIDILDLQTLVYNYN